MDPTTKIVKLSWPQNSSNAMDSSDCNVGRLCSSVSAARQPTESCSTSAFPGKSDLGEFTMSAIPACLFDLPSQWGGQEHVQSQLSELVYTCYLLEAAPGEPSSHQWCPSHLSSACWQWAGSWQLHPSDSGQIHQCEWTPTCRDEWLCKQFAPDNTLQLRYK